MNICQVRILAWRLYSTACQDSALTIFIWALNSSGRAGSTRSTSSAGHSYAPGSSKYTVPSREPMACTRTTRSSSGRSRHSVHAHGWMWWAAGNSRTWSPTRTTPLETRASVRSSRIGPTVSRHCAYKCAWGIAPEVVYVSPSPARACSSESIVNVYDRERVQLRGQPLAALPDDLRHASSLRHLDVSCTGLTRLPDWLWSNRCSSRPDV